MTLSSSSRVFFSLTLKKKKKKSRPCVCCFLRSVTMARMATEGQFITHHPTGTENLSYSHRC
jgi:hypothetical protein